MGEPMDDLRKALQELDAAEQDERDSPPYQDTAAYMRGEKAKEAVVAAARRVAAPP